MDQMDGTAPIVVAYNENKELCGYNKEPEQTYIPSGSYRECSRSSVVSGQREAAKRHIWEPKTNLKVDMANKERSNRRHHCLPNDWSWTATYIPPTRCSQ